MSTDNRLNGYNTGTKRVLSVEFLSTLCYIHSCKRFFYSFSLLGRFFRSYNLLQAKRTRDFSFHPCPFCFSPIFQKYRFLTSNVGTNMTLISFSNSDRLSGASSCFTLPSLVYPVTSRIKLPYCEFGAYLLLSLK